ncbi:hypothetical protein BMS3Abin08_01165 [bacterium BMS3Abin08]|nr:hypothetical protein BMS3Abin08_01165 [bacterium BMS3Abin08]
MDTDKVIYKETTDIILKSFYEVYNELGDGFLESVVTTQVSPFGKGGLRGILLIQHSPNPPSPPFAKGGIIGLSSHNKRKNISDQRLPR